MVRVDQPWLVRWVRIMLLWDERAKIELPNVHNNKLLLPLHLPTLSIPDTIGE